MQHAIVLLFLLYSFCSNGESQSIGVSHTKSTQDTTAVSKLLKLSNQYTVSDPEKAKSYAQHCINIAKLNGYKSHEIGGLYKLGAIHVNQGNREIAKPLFEEGLKKSQKLNNQVFIALGFYNLSRYYEMENVLDKALEYLKQSDTIYKTLNLENRIGYCQTSFGRIYQALGNYDKSLEYYFKSLKINENLNNKAGISVVKTNIGNIYLVTSKFDDALKYFNEALVIDTSNNDQEGILITKLNIGETYQKMKLYTKALKNYNESLVIAKELRYTEDEAILLGNIGSVLKDMGRFETGLKSLFAALTLEETHNFNKAHTLNEISKTYLGLNQPEKSTLYALQAVEYSKETNKINQLRYAYLHLSEAYKNQNDGINAYDALVKSYRIKDSLFNLDKEKQINQLKLTFETEKKEKEILLLTEEKKSTKIKSDKYIIGGLLTLLILFLLYNKQRVQSIKRRLLLKKRNEVDLMKSRFFTNVSHEFRTPLTLIISPIDNLIEKVEQPDLKNRLKVIKQNGQRLLSLVNQILDISKIESGNVVLDTSNSDIIKVIKGMVMSFHSMAESKKIKLQLETVPDELKMNFDKKKFETILVNLLSNAIKFTPEKGQISIKTKLIKQKRKEFIRISVSDNGIGIPKNDVEHIFNRFYQSETNHLQQHKGTGIGLAILKELVELHKGSINVKSKIDKGTRISIEIPTDLPITEQENITAQLYNTKNQTEIDIEEDILILEEEEKITSQKPVILLIEDHKDVSNYIAEILHSKYELVTAKDGQEGTKKALKLIPDLILSDVMMPKKNGYQVCTELKNDERTSHIPIILLTAKSSSENKIEGLSTKADAYLTKPFVPKELMIRIKNLIESRVQLKSKYKKAGILNPKEIAVNSIDEKFLNRLIEVVELHMSNEKFGVVLLSKETGMSRSQLHRKLIGLLGHGPNQFIRTYRLQRAYNLLKQNAATPSEISYQVGFASPSYFTKCFHKHFGYPPSNIEK